ncbi:hypothetical protein APZ00_15705 [Pannonibacter phragmitetus]|jgi:hypothetical protein|uniref:Uncharacterized protein n=1 Tax=Pannonibacter phragmitetus TaxID=121719 RepID=A0A0U2W7B8_9HYPH|nr:hypothetical protein APZ00_15705 [Pannonibacter phragmitetus]
MMSEESLRIGSIAMVVLPENVITFQLAVGSAPRTTAGTGASADGVKAGLATTTSRSWRKGRPSV